MSIPGKPGVLVAVMLGFVLAVSGCSQGPGPAQSVSASRKLYTTAEALAGDAVAIVRGQLGEVRARVQDDGGSGKEMFSFPMVLYRFDVVDSKSTAPLPSSITLAWIDTDKYKVDVEDAVPLAQGREYVLFLEKITEEERGGLKGYGTLYVPVSSNAGVFSIGERGKAMATDRTFVSVQKGAAHQERVNDRMAVDPESLLSLSPGKG